MSSFMAYFGLRYWEKKISMKLNIMDNLSDFFNYGLLYKYIYG